MIQWLSVAALSIPNALADNPNAQEKLLEQVRLGEALHREELVQDSLARLSLIAPEAPPLVLARMRLALRQGDYAQVKALAEQIKPLANTYELRQANGLVSLANAPAQEKLKQARLLASAGQREAAIELFDELFKGAPPDFISELEYWTQVAGIKTRRAEAAYALTELDQRYPGNLALRHNLVQLLWLLKRDSEAQVLLEAMAEQGHSRALAASLQYQYLAKQAPSAELLSAWQRFIENFVGSSQYLQAQDQYQRLKAQLDNPAWQAGERGRALLAQGELARAQVALKKALAGFAQEGGLWGALGTAQMRSKDHQSAVESFGRAAELEQDAYKISKWQDLKQLNEHWWLIQQAQTHLDRGAQTQARQLLGQAHRLKPDEVKPLLLLAQISASDEQALDYLTQVLRLDPLNAKALLSVYERKAQRAAHEAAQYLDGLTPAQQQLLAKPIRALSEKRLLAQADTLERQGEWAQLIPILNTLRRHRPKDAWLLWRLAQAHEAQGDSGDFSEAFIRLARAGKDPEAYYSAGLYLQKKQRLAEASNILTALDKSHWTPAIERLAKDLASVQQRILAQRMYAAGHFVQAHALLAQEQDVEAKRLLARWAFEQKDYDQAQVRYRALLDETASNEALWGLFDTHLAKGEVQAAQQLIQAQGLSELEPWRLKQLASAWQAAGQPEHSRRLWQHALEQGSIDAQMLRDYARLEAPEAPKRALELYAQGLRRAALMDDQPMHITEALHITADDDWLARSLKQESATLYQASNPTLTVLSDYGWREDDNAQGVSDLTSHNTLVNLTLPMKNGQGFFQAEQLSLTTQRQALGAEFGLCALAYHCAPSKQSPSGMMWGAGYENARFSVDIGRTPQGFAQPNWLAGVSYKERAFGLGYRLSLTRRPLTNSLVSFAGAVDPVSGVGWGGITANGLSLNLSRDSGGAQGSWAKLGAYQLLGEKVPDNQRLDLMGGHYWRVLEQTDRRMRVGVNLIGQFYRRDLSKATLGQGGYYSPQAFVSLGLPVSYAARNRDWSWQVEGRVSVSHAKTAASKDYPEFDHDLYSAHHPLLAYSEAAIKGRTTKASSDTGLGVQLTAVMERRLGAHWVAGAGASLQHSQEYSPNRAFLYLRYYLEPWYGPMPFTVEPLSSYAHRP